jgi:hypothetical protein
MRGWAALLAAGTVLVTSDSPAFGQIGLFLASGTGIEPDTTAAYWVSAPMDVRAVAVADIVLLSQNPLNAPLAMLAAAGQTRELSPGLQNPPVGFPFNPAGGASIYGGTLPPGKFGEPANPGSGNGGGAGGGSGGGSGTTPISPGSPLVTLAIDPPTATSDGFVSLTATDANGFPLGSGVSVPVPAGGWWTLGTTKSNIIPGPEPSGTAPGPLVPDLTPPPVVTPDPDPQTGGGGPPPSPPTPVETPEPATAVLGLIGVATVGVKRLRRRPVVA